MSSNPINRSSAIQCFEDNNAVKIHDVIIIELLSGVTTKLRIYFHFEHVDYFLCLKVTQLVLEAQASGEVISGKKCACLL